MIVDKQTLADLEVFKAEDNAVFLLSLLDKTKTAGGKQRLYQKFLHPPGSLEELQKQQEVIRYICNNPISLPFTDSKLKSMEDYLSSNIDKVISGNAWECFWFWLSDRQAWWYLKEWTSEVAGFITGFSQILAPEKKNLPAILDHFHKEVSSMLFDQEFEIVRGGTSKGWRSVIQVLKADKIIRTRFFPHLKNIINWYYDLDALVSMAQSTLENQFQFPVFSDSPDCLFQANGLFHPLLKNPVPVDIKLTSDQNFIFLTGPNMSGKTTFLKTVGITVYLGHLGMGIPAKSGMMKYFDRLFTSLNISDSIANGYSYFYNEVRRVKEMAEALNKGEHIFSLLDELFRGTNVKDAYEASVMVMKGIVPWKESAFILSTHLWETWEQIESFSNVRSYCFESELRKEGPSFSYRMVPGVSNMRLGIRVIEDEQIMALLNKKFYS